jgi:predicted Rossmann-fold nucleotide-binding protein
MAITEIESVQQLQDHLARHGGLDRTVLQGLDLRQAPGLLSQARMSGSVLLGCQLTPEDEAHARQGGALVVPPLGDLPYSPFRPNLYTSRELMQGYVRGDHGSFTRTRDGLIYAHYARHVEDDQPMPVLEALTQRVHDHAIDDALGDLLHNDGTPRRVVAIMGGHALGRGDDSFLQVARLARGLTREGYFVATGGGPGAMEAGNLGAFLAGKDEAELAAAVKTLSRVARYDQEGYFDAAYEVLDLFPEGEESLAIPTWFYGHEPANLFATHVAKYFANSLREDGLLAIARHGVVYAPGSAGTVQEVFMDACQNHYVTFGQVSPMVFLDVAYWTQRIPVFPLLQQLAGSRPYADYLALRDDVDQVLSFILEHPPLEP